ncbi:ornithine cyclodeaminase [Aurantimonas sp. Leaf443]|uniref:ornithine cyclodeaminase family protein n=1 Tax=Aurantimonas sp. Leaf443 TaxID=1736378 RepID=UPI0006FE6129|nr:ornithine cyclodeaminase [Aurantimonas sp. Leaf443]KQT88488.1 ornithine cyclodeaminase [Aurantimonas sp. Leaf443]
MRHISFEEGDGLLTWTDVADAIAAGHRRPRATIKDLLIERDGDSLLSRAAWIEGLGLAVKSMSIFPRNAAREPALPSVQGGMLLFDAETGAPTTLVDGMLVTKWKTAGDSVLGARLLARPSSRTLLVCGGGTVARSLVEAYREVFPGLSTILVWTRDPKKAEAFCADHASDGATMEAAPDLHAALGRADIVSAATMAVSPFLTGADIRPGTHVDLIGAYRPDMREGDDELLARAEIFVDSRETTIGHIGEIEIPLKAGTIALSDIRGDFYDLCAGAPGRSGPEAITLFKNGGGAHLDLMVGDLIRRAVTAAA